MLIKRLPVALALLFGLSGALTACEPDFGAPKVPVSELAPRIATFNATPQDITKDEVITLNVKATDRENKPITYTWTASLGTLSASKGTRVTWSPLNADGTFTSSIAQVSVVADNGLYTDHRTVTLNIKDDGSVTIIPLGNIPTRVPSPTPTPSAAPSDAVATEACAVGEVFPRLAPPGTIVYIGGSGLTDAGEVTVGGRPVTVAARTASRLVIQLPADYPVQDAGREVLVTACGKTLAAQGTVTAAELRSLGADVTRAGAGLRVGVHRLETGETELPADLESKTPYTSFLASAVDVPTTGFWRGFPGPDGLVPEWFALSYTGLLEVTAPGEYQFALASGGGKLYLDGELVIDAADARGLETREGTVTLGAGKHAFRLVARHESGPMSLQLFWAPPGMAETVVPAAAFSHE